MRLIRKFKVLLFIMFVIILSCNQVDKINIPSLITDFYEKYEKDGVETSFNHLFSSNKWMNINDTSLTGLKSEIENTLPDLGEYLGYELIAKKSLGNDYILYSFLTKYERQPIRFTFIVYNINESWQLQNFKYDVDFDQELEKASEAYFLQENY